MSQPPVDTTTPAAPPRLPVDRTQTDGHTDGLVLHPPIIARSPARWLTMLIWLLPLLALIAGGFYYKHWSAHRGAEVTIRVADAYMIDPGNTTIRSRGVEIGRITGVELTDDRAGADVHVQLRVPNADFARRGAKFWVVKPDLSGGSLSGLGTVISGPYIECTPGTGAATDHFEALNAAPITSEDGLHIMLLTNALNRVGPGTPITFRGMPIGTIESTRLADDATHVKIAVVIKSRYAPLVRAGSRFWSVSAADIKGGVFSGIDLKLGSIKSIIAGEIGLATPDDPVGEVAPPGTEFVLHEQMDEAWKKWRPQIAIDPEPTERAPTTQGSISSTDKSKP